MPGGTAFARPTVSKVQFVGPFLFCDFFNSGGKTCINVPEWL